MPPDPGDEQMLNFKNGSVALQVVNSGTGLRVTVMQGDQKIELALTAKEADKLYEAVRDCQHEIDYWND